MIYSSATISPCGRYRYRLGRRWSTEEYARRALFVMLNPSTADARQDDPTIRRCIGFARREGCGALDVVNLFALRATRPQALRAAVQHGRDAVGPDNDMHTELAMASADLVICAWGAQQIHDADLRKAFVMQTAQQMEKSLHCLGPRTRFGHPRHPLYLPADAALLRWIV